LRDAAILRDAYGLTGPGVALACHVLHNGRVTAEPGSALLVYGTPQLRRARLPLTARGLQLAARAARKAQAQAAVEAAFAEGGGK
jgi:hypothetical protein